MANVNEQIKSLFLNIASIEPNTVFMQIRENESIFWFKKNDPIFVTIPVGFELISSRYFKHTPPNYDDIEYAINFIEDEIEKVVPIIPMNEHHLVTNTSFIREIAHLCGIEYKHEMKLSRDELEHLFGQYAEIAMGRQPGPNETDISQRFYAQLLIFREFMHHLRFEEITVIDRVK